MENNKYNFYNKLQPTEQLRQDNLQEMSKAKRCYLLFRYKQPLVCMGLEEAMSPRSVVILL